MWALPSATSARSTRATRWAAGIALAYIVVCCAYIVLSSALAARLAESSVERMAVVEKVKGQAFVVVSGLAFFLFARRVLRRVEERQDALSSSQEALLLAERRALAGAFASSVAHDLNNTLTLLDADAAELADPATAPEERARALQQLRQAVRDLSGQTRRLLEIGRAHPAQPRPLDLRAITEEVVAWSRSHSSLRRCQIAVQGDAHVPVVADASQYGQLLVNLLLNAGDATGGQGRIEVETRARPGGAMLEVSDDGPGLAPEVCARLFQPFVTTKPHGSGLGLLSVKTIAERHGGSVEAARSPLGGALFRVQLAGGTTPPA